MPSHALQTLVFLQGMPYNLAVVNEIREHLVGFPVVPEDTTYEWSRTAAPTVADKARTSCAASSVSLVFFLCVCPRGVVLLLSVGLSLPSLCKHVPFWLSQSCSL